MASLGNHHDEPEDDLVTTSVIVTPIGSLAEKNIARCCGLESLLEQVSLGI
jgi:hypothetical protein